MAGWRCLTSPLPLRSPAMTEAKSKLALTAAKELIKGNPDGLREIVRAVLQEVLEAEMPDALGAAKSERTAGRLGYPPPGSAAARPNRSPPRRAPPRWLRTIPASRTFA